MNFTNLRRLGYIKFPSINYEKRININMMPFVIGDMTSIPKEYNHYINLINKCMIDESRFGEIGYLSIKESYVKINGVQKRAGIHIERRNNNVNNKYILNLYDKPKYGIFMASNISNSCRIWDIEITESQRSQQLQKLQNLIKNPQCAQYEPKENELIWMTDRTPHMSLPLKQYAFRQWFRLIIDPIETWSSECDTINNLGIQPMCKIIN